MFDEVREAERLLSKVVAELEPERSLSSSGSPPSSASGRQARPWPPAGSLSRAYGEAPGNAPRPTSSRLKRATSVGNAVGVLETAERVAELPGTDEALRAGKLSAVQAKEIASAAAADPASEGELLKAAERDGMAGLKEALRAGQGGRPTRRAGPSRGHPGAQVSPSLQ